MKESNSVSVQLVDTQISVRKGIGELLKSMGFVVIADTGDIETTMAIYEAHRPDVVIMDLCLPTADHGFELIRQLSSPDKSGRVLVFTGNRDIGYIRTALELGALGYLNKAAEVDALTESIHRVGGGNHYICAEAARAVAINLIAVKQKRTIQTQNDLTDRELEVLTLICKGKNPKEVAADLDVCARTVRNHKERILKKLNLSSVAELAIYAVKRGIVTG